jgi:hypothetical protein
MALRLVIENETSLPDGGPLSVTVTGQHGIDIGRDQYLDWDPAGPLPLHLGQALRGALPRRGPLAARRVHQRLPSSTGATGASRARTGSVTGTGSTSATT